MLEKYILPMMQTVQRPNLKHLLLWCCKLVKEPTWKVCTVDVTNCSKTLVGNCIMLMLQSVKRPCLKYVFVWSLKLFKGLTWKVYSADVDITNCSKTLLGKCGMLMLQTDACKIYYSDDANCSKTLLGNGIYWSCLMLQILMFKVQNIYLKMCILLMLQTVQWHYLERVLSMFVQIPCLKNISLMMQTVQRPNLKHLLLWCCKLVYLLEMCILLMLQTVQRTHWKNVKWWCSVFC